MAQPRSLEPEEQRAGGRPRRRRDLGSRLQAQRRAQRAAWAEVDENDEEAGIPGKEDGGSSLVGKGAKWRCGTHRLSVGGVFGNHEMQQGR